MDRSDPLDHYLAVQIKQVRRSNRVRPLEVGRLRSKAHGSGGAGRRRRRSRGGGSPEMAEPGPPGVKMDGIWVREDLLGTVIHWWP